MHGNDRPDALRRPGFSWTELVVAVGIIGLLAALLLPLVQGTSRPAARRLQCRNNLRYIALALHHYHDVYDSLPPAYTVDADGQPLHSWRTLILPYLDQAALYESIDLSKPWDDPANATARETVLEIYHCPLLETVSNRTTYAAVVGPDACFLPTGSRRFDEISDGLSHTAMLVELPAESAVPWMTPQDGGAQFLTSWPEDAKHSHGDGAHVIFADGSGHLLSVDTAPDVRAAMVSVADADSVDGL